MKRPYTFWSDLPLSEQGFTRKHCIRKRGRFAIDDTVLKRARMLHRWEKLCEWVRNRRARLIRIKRLFEQIIHLRREQKRMREKSLTLEYFQELCNRNAFYCALCKSRLGSQYYTCSLCGCNYPKISSKMLKPILAAWRTCLFQYAKFKDLNHVNSKSKLSDFIEECDYNALENSVRISSCLPRVLIDVVLSYYVFDESGRGAIRQINKFF